MIDPRMETLAKQLVHYSTNLQKGEKVLVEMIGEETDLVTAIVKEVHKAEAIPFVTIKRPTVTRALLMEATEEQIQDMASWELERMKTVDAYIGIRSGNNINELSDIPKEKMKLYSKLFLRPVHFNERVNNTKWVVLRYPNSTMAQLASMSTQAFEDFYFNVCNLNYLNMSKAMDALVDWMKKTDQVHIKGEGTDLRFSIKEIPPVKCDGQLNIPDGEVYTAPVKESVNGVISYNAPTIYEGVTFENIRLEFKDGKIINATANNTERLNQILDTDEGARYIGEFAIGVNPYILHPMKDILFDEKIAGSFHFTPGNAYQDADNGNRSNVHWDLVCIQRPEYGGGEIYFDDVLIRKDGLFVVPELEPLNPDQLK